jgi:hypothetical protein
MPQPDFGFVEVGAAIAPPLPRAVAAGGKGDTGSIRRRGREVLAGVAIRADRRRRAAFGPDAEKIVHAGDVAARRRKVDPRPIARPRVKPFDPIVERQLPQRACGEVHQINVAATGPVRHEGQRPAIRGVERPRFAGRVRHEQTGFAA